MEHSKEYYDNLVKKMIREHHEECQYRLNCKRCGHLPQPGFTVKNVCYANLTKDGLCKINKEICDKYQK